MTPTELIKNKFYWIKLRQWKDRDTEIDNKWSIAQWDGAAFEELVEMYRIEEVIEIGEQIPSNEEIKELTIVANETRKLAEYKAKLRHKIKELSLEFVNINAQTVFELIDKT